MTMDTRTACRELKSRLKNLAVLQKKTKRARKTTLPKEEYQKLKDEVCPKKTDWYPTNEAFLRRGEITAHLNFYREIRGKEACHSVRHGVEYEYESTLKRLRKEFVIETPKQT
jgi:hypothetical protein